MKISFLLRKPKKLGITAIYASITYRGNRVIIFPNESILTSNWINEKNINEPKPILENKALIKRLKQSETQYRRVYDKLQKQIPGVIPPAILKKAINGTINPTIVPEKNDPHFISDFDRILSKIENLYQEVYDTLRKHTGHLIPSRALNKSICANKFLAVIPPAIGPVLITDFFDTLIKDSKSGERLGMNKIKMNPNSIKPYLSTLNHFTSFQKTKKKIYFLPDINQTLIDDFIKYLNVNQKLSINTSAKYLTVFKLLMSYAKQKKLISLDTFLENKVDVRREKSDNIYLNENEIDSIISLTSFATPLYEIVRDYFVIGCKTGLRFSDYSMLRLENINDGFIELNQQKTGGKVIIPIHPIVEKILMKYPKGLPKCPPNQIFNRYLKDIGKQIPALDKEFEKRITREYSVQRTVYKKWKLLQSHTARRSFCTNEYLNGTPLLTIMSISGHTTQKSFMTYIKATSAEHAEILRKEWEARRELS